MNSAAVVRVLIADNYPLFREGLAAVLRQRQNLRMVAEAEDGGKALAMFRQHRPDVVLMDVRMPGLSGLQTLLLIRKEFPHARVILLSAFETEEEVYQAFQAGAKAYLLKDISAQELCLVIEEVSKGASYMVPSVAGKIAQRLQSPALTAREVEILQLLAQGKSNQAVAAALFISEGTVKAHCSALFAKLGAQDRTHAVVLGLKRGLVHLF